MKKTIRVLIVDDSKVFIQMLRSILAETENIQIIGQAMDGLEALRLTKELKPDLITMDIMMPKMDGVEATRAIMEQCPTPIIIISSHSNEYLTEHSFNALEVGALSIIEKPQALMSKVFAETKQLIIDSIQSLAEVPVVRRRPKPAIKPVAPSLKSENQVFKILALGSSTGGPNALNCILQGLAANFPIPIVITQHITKGFLSGLIGWLQHNTALQLAIAEHNQFLEPGRVYFAPDESHLTVEKTYHGPRALLNNSVAIDHFRPAANALFTSLAKSYPHSAIGGLLTGMGRDGASGLLAMKEAGCYTFAQSESTSVVYGMPGAAVAMQATNEIVDLEQIALFLTKIVYKGEQDG